MTAGVCLSLGTLKTAKGAAKPRPLCTPLGLFLVVQGIRCSYLLTCVCMLRYSARYAVPMLFYFFSFSVVHFWQSARMLRYSMRYAVPMLFYFFSFSVVHFRQGARMLRYSMCYSVPVLFYFFTFSVIHFWQGVCILRYSARYALRSLALNLRRSVSPPAACLPSPSLHQPKYHSHPNLSQPNNQTTNQAATLSHNITTFTPSDTTPKHPPYKPQAAHKPPAAAQPGSWNSRPYKPRSTPYSAPYQ